MSHCFLLSFEHLQCRSKLKACQWRHQQLQSSMHSLGSSSMLLLVVHCLSWEYTYSGHSQRQSTIPCWQEIHLPFVLLLVSLFGTVPVAARTKYGYFFLQYLKKVFHPGASCCSFPSIASLAITRLLLS